MDPTPLVETLTPANFGLVLQLAILEGLLSFDNALALAALVSDRLKHPEDRKKALLWGIGGAYVSRIAVVFVGVWLMANAWIKFLAGAYLLWIAASELFFKKKETEAVEHAAAEEGESAQEHEARMRAESLKRAQEAPRADWKTLWKTILAVELMDIMFSIDSIAVALAVSDQRWVLITGAVLGILMMRVAASFFIKLIVKFPVLVPAAFILVGIAGLKVVLEIEALPFGDQQIKLVGMHIPEAVFMPIMLSVLVGALALNMLFPHKFRYRH